MTETADAPKIDAVVRGLAKTRLEQKGKDRDMILAKLARGRGNDSADKTMAEKLLSNATVERFVRRKRVLVATDTAPTTAPFSANPRPYDPANSADKPTQPEDDGALFIDQVGIELPSNLKLATYNALRNQYGIKVYYEGGKKTRFWPLAEILETCVWVADAGVDNATAGSEAVVAGTHHQIKPPTGFLRLEPKEEIQIKPGESEARIEFILLPEYSSAPTLTGESGAMYAYITWRGHRVGSKHEGA